MAFAKLKLICYITSEERLTTNNVKKTLNIRTGLLYILSQITNKTQKAFFGYQVLCYAAEVSTDNDFMIEFSKCITCGGTKKELQDCTEGE